MSLVFHTVLHNEELNDLYSTNIVWVNKSRRMRCVGHVARMGDRRCLVGKHEGKRSLERPRSRWDEDIKMNLQEVGWGSVDWIDLGQDGHNGGHL